MKLSSLAKTRTVEKINLFLLCALSACLAAGSYYVWKSQTENQRALSEIIKYLAQVRIQSKYNQCHFVPEQISRVQATEEKAIQTEDEPVEEESVKEKTIEEEPVKTCSLKNFDEYSTDSDDYSTASEFGSSDEEEEKCVGGVCQVVQKPNIRKGFMNVFNGNKRNGSFDRIISSMNNRLRIARQDVEMSREKLHPSKDNRDGHIKLVSLNLKRPVAIQEDKDLNEILEELRESDEAELHIDMPEPSVSPKNIPEEPKILNEAQGFNFTRSIPEPSVSPKNIPEAPKVLNEAQEFNFTSFIPKSSFRNNLERPANLKVHFDL